MFRFPKKPSSPPYAWATTPNPLSRLAGEGRGEGLFLHSAPLILRSR
jgi:hypothetical protein